MFRPRNSKSRFSAFGPQTVDPSATVIQNEVMKMKVRAFQPGDEAAIVQLWKDCGLIVPWNDPHMDIQRKLRVQPEMFLIGCSNDQIVATVMAGYDGHRGWINYLAVHPDHQRSGIGSCMMEEAENRLRETGCPKINLQIRSANTKVIEFYRALGFEPDNVVSLGKRLDNSIETEISSLAE